jgi:hypothetical protein
LTSSSFRPTAALRSRSTQDGTRRKARCRPGPNR